MLFKNEAQLKSFLMPKFQNAVMKTQEQVHKIIDIYLQRFYADYDPVMYERTYQLLHSLVKGGVERTGNGYSATVYFDLGYIYGTGANPSGADVMAAAAYGGHGAQGLKIINGGEDVWHTPLEILDAEAIEILKNMLIAEGVPIR